MKSATVRRIAQEIKTTFDQLIRTYLVIVKREKRQKCTKPERGGKSEWKGVAQRVTERKVK